MSRFYNLDKLIRVSVHQPKSYYLEFRKEIKILGYVWQKGGIYEERACASDKYWSTNELFLMENQNKIINGNTIYVKPKCVLHFDDDYNETYYFDTYEEAFAKAKGLEEIF